MFRCFCGGSDEDARRVSYGHSFGEQDPDLNYWHDPAVRKRKSEWNGALPAHVKAAAAAAEAAVMEKFKANQARRVAELEQQSFAYKQQQAALAAWNAIQAQHKHQHQQLAPAEEPQELFRRRTTFGSSAPDVGVPAPETPRPPVPTLQRLGSGPAVMRDGVTACSSETGGVSGPQVAGQSSALRAPPSLPTPRAVSDDDDDDNDDTGSDYTDTTSSEEDAGAGPSAASSAGPPRMSASALEATRRVEQQILAKFAANKAAREAAAAAAGRR